jgi:dihydrolipoamide dehydrogenase
MSYDLIVIGTGPGGYVCAIRAAQLGLKTAVVEKRKTHGGTCLNIGCIPSKALLHASHSFEDAKSHFPAMGVVVGEPKLDLAKMQAFKQEGVDGNTKGVEFLLKKNKIDAFIGTARIAAPGQVEVTAEDGTKQILETKNIVIATGSDVTRLPGIEIDEKVIISSTGALELTTVPKRLVVIGAGVIGLELGSVWRRLGSDVTVVEYLDRILPGMDSEVARQFQRMLQKQGMEFKLSSKVAGIDKQDDGSLKVRVDPAKGGDMEIIDADVALVAIGRKPFTDGLGLDIVGVALDERGRVRVDQHYKTSVDGIYAIGDVIAGPMLAHKAEDEGIAVAEILNGQAGHVNYAVIPAVVYTNPEIASVGKTEDELKAAGIEYKIGKFPFTANGRAKAMLATQGFVKILADVDTDRVLGAHIVGKNAGEMIHELVVLMEFSGSAEDLARSTHAHPTLSEAVREAALSLGDGAIHI